MTTPTATKSNKLPPPPALAVKRRRKTEGELYHVISTIGIDTSKIDGVIVTQGIKHIPALDSITEYQMRYTSSMNKRR